MILMNRQVNSLQLTRCNFTCRWQAGVNLMVVDLSVIYSLYSYVGDW